MKDKVKKYSVVRSVKHDGHVYTVLIYAECVQTSKTKALLVQPVYTTRDGQKIVSEAGRGQLLSTQRPYQRTRSLNIGWAICSDEDKFDMDAGVELCKKRFSRDPITTGCGRFLTDDMVNAIIMNELDYIANNFGKFYRRKSKKHGKPKFYLEFPCDWFDKKAPKCEKTGKNDTQKCEEEPKPKFPVRDGDILYKTSQSGRKTTYICVKERLLDGVYKIYWSASEFDDGKGILFCDYSVAEPGLEPEEGYLKTSPQQHAHALAIIRNEGHLWSTVNKKFTRGHVGVDVGCSEDNK